ncbi:hypothetical protein [Fusobacterium sp.]|uniref:hypothetical protein n=1 Tax=Fusobacterium sp. TaxID=68766 RepID=UPI0025BAA0D1|nr:hypothetical protein [Fusobacterium sp.]
MNIVAIIGGVTNKLIDLFSKKSKNGEKQQDIEVKKLDLFNKVIAIIMLGVFLMCVLASIFPKLSITEWWFNIFERMINYLFTN